MASITLHELRIHPVGRPEEEVQAPIFGSFSSPLSSPGEVRTRANGRRVAISRPGEHTTLDISMPELDRLDAERLASWAGETVQVREPAAPRGRVIYGVFWQANVTEIDGGEWVNVDLSVEQVSFDEGV